jgi:adenylate cyclase
MTAGKAGEGERRVLRYLRNPLVILAALAGGAALGLFARDAGIALEPVGRAYLFLLQMTVIPILVTAIATGVASLTQQPHAGRLLLRTGLVFVAFFAIAAAAALAAGILGHPGLIAGDDRTAYLAQLIRTRSQDTDISVSLSAAAGERARGSLFEMVYQIVPRNIFESLSAGSVAQIMVFSVVFGLAIGLLREKQRDSLVDTGQRVLDAFKRINLWLIYALPFAAVALVARQVALSDAAALYAIGRFLCIIGAALAAGFALAFAATWIRTGRSLRAVLSAMVEPLTYAFITGESLVAAPYAIRAAHERLGYDQATANAAVPVTMVIGRFGYIVYYALAAVFVADFYAVTLFPTDYLILVVAAAVAALATPGMAAAGSLGMIGLALGPLGLPAEPALTVFASSGLLIAPLIAVFDTQASVAAAVFIARRQGASRPEAEAVRRIPLRTSLVTLIAILIVLTGTVTLGLMVSAQRRNITYLADGMIAEISARVMQRTGNYFGPAERTLGSLQYLMENGTVDPARRLALIDVMRQAITTNPEFAAVYFGDASGAFTMVKRMPDGSLSNRIITRTRDAVSVTWEHANLEYARSFASGTESPETGYDPRTRGWYRDALASGRRIWTNVYLFASDNMLGISNAVAVRRGGAVSGVLAIDIGLAELSYFLGSLDVSENGKAYILDGKNELVALSMPRGSDLSALFSGRPTGSASSSANLVLADETRDELVRESFLASLRAADKGASFSFRAGGEKYLSRIIRFPQDALFAWKIGIVLPEARIYEYVNQTSRIVLYAALLIIVVAIGLGVNFSRAITVPLRRLSREMERIRDFDLSGSLDITSRITEVHSMTDAFASMKHGLAAFNKYVPSKLVAQLIRLGEEPRIGGRRRELTLLFSDVADFTTISEQLSPEELVDQMAVYFAALSNVIMGHRGTVDKYIGDAIMAFWNAPVPVEDHARAACGAALACQRALRGLRAGGAKRGGRPVPLFEARTRMGIHTGEVIVGNMGSEERLNYTAIGDSVNLASRLEGLNKVYGTTIIVSETTRAAAGSAAATRLLDRVAVKGRRGGLQIYELLDPDGEGAEAGDFAGLAAQAVESYLAAQFDRALSLIAGAARIRPQDKALAVIAQRCEAFKAAPPSPDWDGVYVYHEK